jgi:hypothetical protein
MWRRERLGLSDDPAHWTQALQRSTVALPFAERNPRRLCSYLKDSRQLVAADAGHCISLKKMRRVTPIYDSSGTE